ncbi:MAG: GAF domain-containing sensor histidine kinase [Chitinophagales bacterium]
MSRTENTSKFSNLEEYLTHILMRLVQAENEFEVIRLLNSVFDNFPQIKYAGLYLKDEIEEDRLYMPFAYGFEIEEARSANRSAEERHPGFVMRSKEILHIPNTQDYNGLSSSELGRKTEVKSRLWVPLLDQSTCFGSVGAASDEVNAFDKDFIDFFAKLGTIFGTAFRHQMHKHVLMSRESSYRHLVDESYDLVMVVDNTFKLLFCNAAWMDTMRYNQEEINAMRFTDLLVQDSEYQSIVDMLSSMMSRADFSRHEINFTLNSKFGESIYLEGIGVTYATEDHKAVEFVVKNITTQVLTEKRIQNLARFPMENPNPVMRLSFKNKMLFYNDAGERIVNQLGKEGRTGDFCPFGPIIEQCIEKGFAIEDVSIGNQIFSFSAVAIQSERYVNFYGRDVTERVETERKLEIERDKLQTMTDEVNALNDTLANQLTLISDNLKQTGKEQNQLSLLFGHDLKSPARQVSTMSSLLKRYLKEEPHANPRIEQITNHLFESSARLEAMMTGLQKFTGINQDKIELLEFDVLETMKSIAHLLVQGDTTYQKHQIVWIHEEVSYSIVSDISMFSLMIQNLISNALKYSADETHPKVTIETKKVGKFLEITIRDNGIGFAPGSKEKLFNMFYREKRGNFEGTGVGLASALKIADILNAFIQADGKEGEGASFTLTIPLSLSPKQS